MFSHCTRSASLLCLAILLASLTGVSARQLSSRPADEWIKTLERPERVAGLKIDEIIARLDLEPGDTVADLGAGTGVFSLPLARAVGPSGTVYAVEIEQGLLDHIGNRAKESGVGNVRTVRGEFVDPKLPTRDVDLAFFHDVLHHVKDRAGYLRALASYLAPDGRIAVVELDAAHPRSPHREQAELQVTREQLAGWMNDAGLERLREINLFEDKWFVVYGKTAKR
jgi:ubiquinone/menaquinone biosynthesis C-methylase UbiE